MRLRNILIVVKDIERSIRFYHDLFGLDIVRDFLFKGHMTEI